MDLASVRKMYTGSGFASISEYCNKDKIEGMIERRKEVLAKIKRTGAIGVNKLAKEMKLARGTVADDVNFLFEKGLVVKIDNGNARKVKTTINVEEF